MLANSESDRTYLGGSASAPRNISRRYDDTVVPWPGRRVPRYVARTSSSGMASSADRPTVSARILR